MLHFNDSDTMKLWKADIALAEEQIKNVNKELMSIKIFFR